MPFAVPVAWLDREPRGPGYAGHPGTNIYRPEPILGVTPGRALSRARVPVFLRDRPLLRANVGKKECRKHESEKEKGEGLKHAGKQATTQATPRAYREGREREGRKEEKRIHPKTSLCVSWPRPPVHIPSLLSWRLPATPRCGTTKLGFRGIDG